MLRSRMLVLSISAMFVVAACGSDQASNTDGTVQLPEAAAETAPNQQPTSPDEAGPTVDLGDVVTPAPQFQTVELAQPAVWPGSDEVLATPEETAERFVSDVLGVEPVLGDYMGGDSRSGEIPVFSPGEGGGGELLERGLLGLRIIGPNDGWFVIAATSAAVMIDQPQTLDEVPAGPLVVSGRGWAFEGTLVVRALRPGEAGDVIDQEIGAGGAMGTLEPFSVTLDLSGATPGETIAIVVQGDTGLGGDPGNFAALPITVADDLPETR